jgi:hypothetical protein
MKCEVRTYQRVAKLLGGPAFSEFLSQGAIHPLQPALLGNVPTNFEWGTSEAGT